MQFSAQVWNPEKPYLNKYVGFRPRQEPLFIYESHIGMSSTEERVSTISFCLSSSRLAFYFIAFLLTSSLIFN